MDYCSASLELKTVSLEKRTIAAYVASHNNIDRVRDIIDPQASVKAVARIKRPSDIPVFVGHDSSMLPVGIPQVIEAHPRGLYTETLIKPGPVGDDLLHTARFLQQHGIPLGASIGYRTHDSRHEMTHRGRVRRILDYELKEYSFASPHVTASPEAHVTDIKARRRKALGEGSDTAGGFVASGRTRKQSYPCAVCEEAGEGEQDGCTCPGCAEGDGECRCAAAMEGRKMQYRVAQEDGAWSVYCDLDEDGDEDDNRLVGTYASEDMANAVVIALRGQARAYGGGTAYDDSGEEEYMAGGAKMDGDGGHSHRGGDDGAHAHGDGEEDGGHDHADGGDGAHRHGDGPLGGGHDHTRGDGTHEHGGVKHAHGPARGGWSRKAVWTTAYMNDLPDSAFMYIEPGGTRDEGGRTVPRSKRHFPIRDANGKIDLPHVRNAIQRIPQGKAEGLDEAKKASLQARARRILERAGDGKVYVEPAEWKTGSPVTVRALAYRLIDLSERMAEELKAMALLGEETKGYQRVRPAARDELATIGAELARLVAHAERIDSGEDGRARVAWLKQQLALTEV